MQEGITDAVVSLGKDSSGLWVVEICSQLDDCPEFVNAFFVFLVHGVQFSHSAVNQEQKLCNV
jgi:hypothetical protein